MKIFLTQGKLKLKFPLLPSEFSVSDGNNNETVNILGKRGDINLLGNRQLRTITLSGTFPKDNSHVLHGKQYNNIPTGHNCIIRIMTMLRTNSGIVSFLATGVTKGTFTIESFTHSLNAGGYYSYSLTLKQYVKPKLVIKRKNNGKTTVNNTKKVIKASGKRVSKETKTTVYVVKKGDTLSQIAKKLTGDSNNYMAIANQNNIKNPHLIYPNQKLVIKIDS